MDRCLVNKLKRIYDIITKDFNSPLPFYKQEFERKVTIEDNSGFKKDTSDKTFFSYTRVRVSN